MTDILEKTVKAVAKECYDEAGGDVRKATDLLEAQVRGDQRLFEEAMGPLVRQTCYSIISGQLRTDRKRVWTAPVHNGGDKPSRVNAIAAGTLMMFPMPGGKKLKDATLQEVSEARAMYNDQAMDMSFKARWLGLIEKDLPEGKKVLDVFDETMLNDLKDRASA